MVNESGGGGGSSSRVDDDLDEAKGGHRGDFLRERRGSESVYIKLTKEH